MRRVLIIDDDEITRAFARHFLQEAGYEVIDTDSGDHALRLLETEAIDLIITDLMMPAKDGLQTILEIQRLPRKYKIIAISSGGPSQSTRLLKVAKSYGAVQTLLKPLTPDALLEAVSQALEANP
jgi:CheY-like chemotaxis protein